MSLAEIPFVLWVILGLLAIGSLISASLTYRMIHLVNRKLPAENQIRYLFLYPGKLSRLNLFYKQFYPSGRLLFWSRVLYFAPFAWLLAAGLWILGIVK